MKIRIEFAHSDGNAVIEATRSSESVGARHDPYEQITWKGKITTCCHETDFELKEVAGFVTGDWDGETLKLDNKEDNYQAAFEVFDALERASTISCYC